MTLPDYPKDVVTWAPQLPNEWLRELGRIALFAASVEETLHLIYWKNAKIVGLTGMIITGDLRPNRLAEDIVKLMKARNVKKRKSADMELLLTEYKALGVQRNQCLHWIWGIVQEGKAPINRPAYKGAGASPEYTLPMLVILADDLAWLRLRLLNHLGTDKNLMAVRANADSSFRALVPAPWLDKLPPPSPKQSTNRAIRKSRLRRHRASRA